MSTGKDTDNVHLDTSAIDFHARVRQGKLYQKAYPHEAQIDNRHFDALKKTMYQNEETNIAALFHTEKLLSLAVIETQENIVWEGMRRIEAQEMYQTGYIIATMAAGDNAKPLQRWQRKFKEVYEPFHAQNHKKLLAHDLLTIAKLGELSAYMKYRTDFLYDEFSDNGECVLPTINEIIFKRLHANVL